MLEFWWRGWREEGGGTTRRQVTYKLVKKDVRRKYVRKEHLSKWTTLLLVAKSTKYGTHQRVEDWRLQLFIGVLALVHETHTFLVNVSICELVSVYFPSIGKWRPAYRTLPFHADASIGTSTFSLNHSSAVYLRANDPWPLVYSSVFGEAFCNTSQFLHVLQDIPHPSPVMMMCWIIRRITKRYIVFKRLLAFFYRPPTFTDTSCEQIGNQRN